MKFEMTKNVLWLDGDILSTNFEIRCDGTFVTPIPESFDVVCKFDNGKKILVETNDSTIYYVFDTTKKKDNYKQLKERNFYETKNINGKTFVIALLCEWDHMRNPEEGDCYLLKNSKSIIPIPEDCGNLMYVEELRKIAHTNQDMQDVENIYVCTLNKKSRKTYYNILAGDKWLMKEWFTNKPLKSGKYILVGSDESRNEWDIVYDGLEIIPEGPFICKATSEDWRVEKLGFSSPIFVKRKDGKCNVIESYDPAATGFFVFDKFYDDLCITKIKREDYSIKALAVKDGDTTYVNIPTMDSYHHKTFLLESDKPPVEIYIDGRTFAILTVGDYYKIFYREKRKYVLENEKIESIMLGGQRKEQAWRGGKKEGYTFIAAFTEDGKKFLAIPRLDRGEMFREELEINYNKNSGELKIKDLDGREYTITI